MKILFIVLGLFFIICSLLGVYEQAVKWFRNADEEELQRGIEQIRSVPKDVPLP